MRISNKHWLCVKMADTLLLQVLLNEPLTKQQNIFDKTKLKNSIQNGNRNCISILGSKLVIEAVSKILCMSI